jgi:hypothetical protein
MYTIFRFLLRFIYKLCIGFIIVNYFISIHNGTLTEFVFCIFRSYVCACAYACVRGVCVCVHTRSVEITLLLIYYYYYINTTALIIVTSQRCHLISSHKNAVYVFYPHKLNTGTANKIDLQNSAVSLLNQCRVYVAGQKPTELNKFIIVFTKPTTGCHPKPA